MHRPSPTALKARARALVEGMTDRARWIYALPPEEAKRDIPPIFEAHGFLRQDMADDAKVAKWTRDDAGLTVLDRPDLEVVLVEGQGAEAAGALGDLLAKMGYYAQSTLLASAFDVGSEDARKALLTLAHMVVAWDADWAELFLLHLASPDPIVRHDAVTALSVAALVARDKGPCLELLAEAARRETFPKLKETIDEARALVAAIATN
jgi:hypothetical protein